MKIYKPPKFKYFTNKMLLLYLYLAIFISCNTCGEEDIDNCATCGLNDKSDQCGLCEDKYFPFLSNVLCLPCDHYYFGNIGCGGKCDSSKYSEIRNVLCEEGGCKEGYYNIEGICFPCSVGDDYCTKCTYKPDSSIKYNNETLLKYFKCQECINNKYHINEYGRCEHCCIRYCLECHYNSFFDKKPICDRCIRGYYVNSEGFCSKCHCPVLIPNGSCMVCSDNSLDFSKAECQCNDTYVLTAQAECSKCPENCLHCNYQNSKKICYECLPGYYLNSNKECMSCGDNCKYCNLDKNKNIICKQCFEGFKLNENKNCLTCPENCDNCKLDKNKIICTKCKENYGLNNYGICKECPNNCTECYWRNSKNDFGCSKCQNDTFYPFEYNYIIGKNERCVRCHDIINIGGKGCIECSYNKYNDKYLCSRCLGDTRGLKKCDNCPIPNFYEDPIKDYAYITNEFKCLLNTEYYPEYLNGCLQAKYNSFTKKYECQICKPEFIPISDERSCRKPEDINLNSDCILAKTLITSKGKLYTCLQCKFGLENWNFFSYLGVIYFRDKIKITTAYLEYWNAKVVNYLGQMNCSYQIDKLENCLKAKEDIYGNKKCTKCIYNYPFKYSSKYEKEICYNKCRPYSFAKFKWCYFCDDQYYGNPGCIKEKGCSYNNANDQLDCVECKKGYFNMLGQCFPCENKLIACDECHFGEKGAFFDKCKDGYTLNSETGKCELTPSNKIECKENFFKTKNNECVFCKSNNN